MSLTSAINLLCDAALSLVYPQACAACGVGSVEARADAPACAACWAGTRVFTGRETLCWKCGAPAPGEVPESERAGVRCRRCEAEGFTAARACGLYEGALRAAVLELKREPFVSARLARLLAEARERKPLDEWSLVRVAGSVRHRAGMDARGRRETVEEAFAVARPRLVRGERVLLIDDVFTTGATASACAAALRAAGAREVYVLTLARAGPR